MSTARAPGGASLLDTGGPFRWRTRRVAPHQLEGALNDLERDGYAFVQVLAEPPWCWVLGRRSRAMPAP